jgi:diacylglycerol kinase
MIGLIHSFKYALTGLRLAVEVDRNVRIHIIVGLLVFILSIFLGISRIEFIFILFSIFFVLITEMMNTAIEEMTNLIILEHRREARIAKDVAAAAVLLASVFALVTGIIIFVPYLLKFF